MPSVILTHTHTLLFVSLLFGEIGFRSALFIVTSRMSYFSNVSFVLCGLCSHSRREAAQAPEGPPGPPAGRDLDQDRAFGHASKCFH